MKRAILAIGLTTVAAALLFAALAAALPSRAKVSLAFTIAERTRQDTTDYSYDGYYALRASELVADTLISWLSTPSIIKEIYAAAGVDATDAEVFSAAGRAFRAKKFSSQNVVVSFSAESEAVADRLAVATANTLSNKADALVVTSAQSPLFSVTASQPVIAFTGFSPFRAGLAGAFVGAFLGLMLLYVASERKRL